MVVAGRETIVHCGTSNNFRPPRPDECVANARLIAAAPDLLEVVRDVVSDSKGHVNPAFYELAVAALDKAEGRSTTPSIDGATNQNNEGAE